MNGSPGRLILLDDCDETREVLARRLRGQGYVVETASDPATAADMALGAPPSAVISDLWMPSISGVQLCRLLRAEPATADVPVILRGPHDDPRSRFWAERAGAIAYVVKGRMGDLVRALSRATAARPSDADAFFMQLSGGSVDIRDRIARYLDAALFDSVIASEVRALATCGSFESLFDRFSQFLSQVVEYRWLAMTTGTRSHFALHHHPGHGDGAEREARAALDLDASFVAQRVEDADARSDGAVGAVLVREVLFGGACIGRVAMRASGVGEADAAALLTLVASELGGPVRMTSLVEESQRLATIDPLTSLVNRRAFVSGMGTEQARSHRYTLPLSLLLLDVDHFKSVNDAHGHAGGDAVLAALGGILRAGLRVSDVAARWGGEEFVVALTNTPAEGAVVVAERIRAAIERAEVRDANGQQIPITASIGVATLRAGESVDALIDRADHAMYAAKRAGRNRVVVATADAESLVHCARPDGAIARGVDAPVSAP